MQQSHQPHYELSPEDKKRRQRIADAWCAYDGDFDPPLSKMPDQPDDNVISNRCRQIVDRGIDFLFGKELEISVEEGAPEDAQVFLNAIWGRKETRIPLLQKLAMNGAMAGQAFLRIVPSPGQKQPYRLVIVDPAIVSVQTAPQDCETVLCYHLEYSTQQKLSGTQPETVYYCEEIARNDPGDTSSIGESTNDDGADTDVTWAVNHWTRVGERGPWQLAGPAIPWPYPFPPLFACQNLPRPNSFWGFPDLPASIIGQNTALNLVNSSINRVLKLYGQPVLYTNNVGEGQIDIKPGKIIGLGENGDIKAVPIASGSAEGLNFAADLRSDLDEESSVPGVATGRIKDMPRGNLSGIAIELLFMPITKKTDKKQCLYGELIIDVSHALLVLNSMSGDIDMTLAWQSPLPHDDLPSVQSAIAKKEVGISNTTLQRELGYDPEEEKALSEAEAADATPSTMPTALPGAPPLPGQPKPAPVAGSIPATVPQQEGQPQNA